MSDEDAAGDALGEGDASVLAFFFVAVDDAEEVPASFFFAVVEEVAAADVPVFFAVVAVVDFLAVVVALVALLLVVVADVSFLCAQDARRPIAAETAMKGNTNFFIGMLCSPESVQPAGKGKHIPKSGAYFEWLFFLVKEECRFPRVDYLA